MLVEGVRGPDPFYSVLDAHGVLLGWSERPEFGDGATTAFDASGERFASFVPDDYDGATVQFGVIRPDSVELDQVVRYDWFGHLEHRAALSWLPGGALLVALMAIDSGYMSAGLLEPEARAVRFAVDVAGPAADDPYLHDELLGVRPSIAVHEQRAYVGGRRAVAVLDLSSGEIVRHLDVELDGHVVSVIGFDYAMVAVDHTGALASVDWLP